MRLRIWLGASALVVTTAAWADHPPVADQGGRLGAANGHRVELVTRDGAVEVLLKDEHNRPLPAAGWTGKAVVMAPGGKAEVPLAVDSGNRLAGSLPAGGELAAAVVTLAARGRSVSVRFPALAPPADRPDAYDVRAGKALYQANCAVCHGDKLQGQPNWQTPLASGERPAPPLDATGHAWHHGDDRLVAAIRDGSPPMPAFGAVLKETDIQALIAYIKSTWPLATLAQQPKASGAAPEPMHFHRAGH